MQRFASEGKLNGISMEWLKNSRVQFGVMIIAAALVAILLVLWLWSSSISYVPLYGRYQSVDQSKVLSVLSKSDIDARINPSTGQILVDASKLDQARIKLAASGVKARLPEGMEALEKPQEIGATQFVETIRYRQGLEGQLARSIMALDPIGYAIVHLGIPQQNQFVGRAEGEPKASVLVELKNGRTLDIEQVQAIVNLVSGSVPALKPSKVTVEDQSGHVLTAELNQLKQPIGQANWRLKYVTQVQDKYIQQVKEILKPVLGANNFQVEVNAKVDFDTLDQMSERYSPNDRNIVSEDIKNNQTTGMQAANGIPGALSNTPQVRGTKANAKPQLENHNDETHRQFALNKTVSKLSQTPGSISKLSVAVILNSAALDTKKGAKASQKEQALAQIKQLVASTVGYNAKRGDTLTVEPMPFLPSKPFIAPPQLPWWKSPLIMGYMKYGIALILALALIWILGRPLARLLIGQKSMSNLALPSSDDADALSDKIVENLLQDQQSEMPRHERFQKFAPLDKSLDGRLKQLRQLAENDPARAAQVIKLWIKNNGH